MRESMNANERWTEEESRLREGEEDYRAVFELAGVGMAEADPRTGRFLRANPEMCRITGYPEEELLGTTFVEITHPDDREETREGFRRVVLGGAHEHSTQQRYVRKDGSVAWVRVNVRLIRDEAGRPLRAVAAIQDVTGRKQDVEALKENEERFRLLVEGVKDYAIFMLDPEGRITTWNEGAERIKGYGAGEILGRHFSAFYPDDAVERSHPDRELRAAAAEGRYEEEGWRVRKDGSWFWASVLITALKDREGNLRGFAKVTRDVTERKRAEEALRRQADLLELSHEPIFAWELGGVVVYWNRGCEELYGFSRGEAVGRVSHELLRTVHPVPFDRFEDALERDGLWVGELEHTTRDGRRVVVESRHMLERSADDRADGRRLVLETNRDVTERKRAEEELRTRQHQQAAVAELGLRALEEEDDLQGVMDEAVNLLRQALNTDYCKVLELLPGGTELLLRAGVGWKEGLVGKATMGADLDSQVGYTLLSEEPVIVENLGAEPRFSGPPLLREHGVVSGMSVVIRGWVGPFGVLGAHAKERRVFTEDDVNFLQAVANVLAAAVEREQSERKLREVRGAERDRLARELHDEALQDLTYALAETQLVQKTPEGPELGHGLQRAAEALKRAGQGLHGAIFDLRLEGADRERTLVGLFESLVELNRRASPPGRQIKLSVEEGFSPPLPEKKRTELVRLVREALTNARRHSEARRVRVAAGTSGGKLWAEVTDDGRGFDPQKVSAGMGTRGMRERARLLGGVLKIVSKPGEGTRVRFELDLEGKQSQEEEVRILLVEDHASLRQAVASTLGREPSFSVVGQAGSLSEAREMFEGIDVAIVDLGLPDGHGSELIKELRARNRRAQALVLTASYDRAEVARAIEAGAAGVLHKSAGMDEIAEAVRRLQAGESLMPLEEVVELLRFAGSRKDQEHEARRAIEKLTPREREVLRALAEGLDSREIAERLYISAKTERNHMASILAKLGIHSRLQALVFALRHGVVDVR